MNVEFDSGFFKVLARNDTGETGSHQGGIVLPRKLAAYFPSISIASGPTADHEILAELFDHNTYIDTVQTRFQSQTWGGERSPEYRLTRNLKPLLSKAKAGDIVVFKRQLGTDDRFRLVLIRRGTLEHKSIETTAKSASVLDPAEPPATQADINKAAELTKEAVLKPFVPTEANAQIKLSIVQRKVRTELFQTVVRSSYNYLCALCGQGMLTPRQIPEVEAAHIIPRGDNGTNDPRNGIALCCSHHWAFDRLLWTMSADRKILVPAKIAAILGNAELAKLRGKPLRVPREASLAPALEAIDHHRKRTISAWGQ